MLQHQVRCLLETMLAAAAQPVVPEAGLSAGREGWCPKRCTYAEMG
jgi:hypothetical protein